MRYFCFMIVSLLLMIFSVNTWAMEVVPGEQYIGSPTVDNCAILIPIAVDPIYEIQMTAYIYILGKSNQLKLYGIEFAAGDYRKTVIRQSWEVVKPTDRTVLV